jgi:hypothetical protein
MALILKPKRHCDAHFTIGLSIRCCPWIHALFAVPSAFIHQCWDCLPMCLENMLGIVPSCAGQCDGTPRFSPCRFWARTNALWLPCCQRTAAWRPTRAASRLIGACGENPKPRTLFHLAHALLLCPATIDPLHCHRRPPYRQPCHLTLPFLSFHSIAAATFVFDEPILLMLLLLEARLEACRASGRQDGDVGMGVILS